METPQIVCPQCGAASPLPAGERYPRCPFCAVALFVDRSGLVGHYLLPRLLDETAAREALRRWMAGDTTARGLDREAEIAPPEPLWFPLWLFRGRSARGAEVAVEPAAATAIPQLADLAIPAGTLAPFAPAAAGGRRVAPTVPLATARGWLAQRGGFAVEEEGLVEVPLWDCAYRWRGSPFRALVEASTGAVFAAVFPEKAETPYVAVAVLGLLLFGLEGLWIGDPLVKIFAYAATAVPLVGLAWWVSRRV